MEGNGWRAGSRKMGRFVGKPRRGRLSICAKKTAAALPGEGYPVRRNAAPSVRFLSILILAARRVHRHASPAKATDRALFGA